MNAPPSRTSGFDAAHWLLRADIRAARASVAVYSARLDADALELDMLARGLECGALDVADAINIAREHDVAKWLKTTTDGGTP